MQQLVNLYENNSDERGEDPTTHTASYIFKAKAHSA